MKKILIHNARITNEGRTFTGSVSIEGEKIKEIYENGNPPLEEMDEVIDASGKWLLPGVIDDQVHFREPGLTHKGDITSESRAAVAGGVTTYMDMPNTKPQTVTIRDWEWKMERAAEVSAANYSFFFGGTNDNIQEVKKVDRSQVPGLKLFLGSSTGNMLVDRKETLERIFGETDLLIAVHAEKEEIIQKNIVHYTNLYGPDLGVRFHPRIRSEEACYVASAEAVELATRLNSRLHILHLSTARELTLLSNAVPLSSKRITAEVCVHHLWFHDGDYAQYGNRIKWNPAIKTIHDRDSLRDAVNSDKVDIIATDHAPHLLSEKEGNCFQAASGGPLVQHSLVAMLDMVSQGIFTIEKVVDKMSHLPAELFGIDRRGYIRPGYYADLVLVDPAQSQEVTKDNLFYKCGWSPFEGHTFPHIVWKTFVNGQMAYSEGELVNVKAGKAVTFGENRNEK